MKQSKSDLILAEYEKRPWTKWYPKGVPADIDIPEKSIPDMIDEAVKKWGNKTSIIFYGRKLKHKEIQELSLKFATALHNLGVKKGNRVAILLPNCPQFIIAYFGILRIGAVASPMSPLYSPREIKHQVNDNGSKIIVCLDLLFEKVEQVWEETGLKHAIITSIEDYLPKMGRFFGKVSGRTLSVEISKKVEVSLFQDLIKKYPPNPPKIEINPKEDLAALPYTGGTTGVPKGAMLTHYNVAAIQEEMFKSFPDIEDGKECTIALLPFYHIYGQSVIMMTGAIRGGLGILFAKPDLESIISAMEKYNVTLFYGVPTLYKYFLDVKRARRFNWKKLKHIFCGADTLHKEVRKDWMRFMNKEIREGYGLTETTAVTHTNPLGRNKPGSFGVPLPNTHAAIIDPETKEFLPQGKEGELIVSAPQIMKGYWNNPKANEESFIKAGGRTWFRTGDIARMDDEGYFYFVERIKDWIKYKGYSVFAHEIEEVLYDHPKIKEAAVIGVPDPEVGERVKAIVVPEIDYRGKLTDEEVVEWCEKNLAHYKVPKIVEFRGEIPKTDAFKIDHKKLRAELFLVKEK
ncbi:MAG: long-chain fatty acid--CoA ligase [Candidatus Bathyarchaeota archaeon]|nr:MAG: long-chain fatty acid--CoA ligase [Candidatus Bathyarchaeota archaeon]